jgi:hypothetical protein
MRTDTERFNWTESAHLKVSIHSLSGGTWTVWVEPQHNMSLSYTGKTLREAIDLAMDGSAETVAKLGGGK